MTTMRGTISGPGIRTLRESMGLSVTQFAAVLGVHPNSVHRWERLHDAPVEGVPLAVISGLRERLERPVPKHDAAAVGKQVQNKLAIGGMVLALAFLFLLLTAED